MKKSLKKVITYFTVCCLFTSVVTVMPNSPLSIVSEAHQGRTDSNGGHKDNKNKSGLGSYHYHCDENPAHLHTDGVCPYSSVSSVDIEEVKQDNINSLTTPYYSVNETVAANSVLTGQWRQNESGWWYELSDGQYYKSQFGTVNNQTYYFNDSGYMITGWIQLGGAWFYFNSDGTMVTGAKTIDGVSYFFDTDGAML